MWNTYISNLISCEDRYSSRGRCPLRVLTVNVKFFVPEEDIWIDSDPDNAFDPDQEPEAEHEEALEVDHERVVESSTSISASETEKFIETKGIVGAEAEPPPPPPPHEIKTNGIKKKQVSLKNKRIFK